VKREQNQPVAGLTIGFWLPHGDLKGFTYDAYTVSVDQIEEWTGFDLFVNLPDGAEIQAESNADWADFINY
jgi:DNA/RNA endonuclease G (NUC1)